MPDSATELRMQEIQGRLNRLDRRDWWMWWAAIAVMLLLTVGIVSLSFPSLLGTEDWNYQMDLDQAVRALVGTVLLFNTYALYQQLRIKQLRRELGAQIQTAVQMQAAAAEFEKLAVQDALTGLHNRRYLLERLAAEIARARRYHHSLTVVAFDLDEFKAINDTHGHAAGDLALTAFGKRLAEAVRASDEAARLGGDEFVAVLVECLPEHATALIARIGKVEAEFQGRNLPVRYSAGWTGYQEGDTPEKLLERADQALYESKRAAKAIAN